jgi:hypothetical protein
MELKVTRNRFYYKKWKYGPDDAEDRARGVR